MTRLRFAFKTLHVFCCVFWVCSNHVGDTNRGIQFLHVDTSGRLLHRQRKEAAGFEHVKKPTKSDILLRKKSRILLALVACQSFIVLVDRMISHFHSFFGSAFEAFDRAAGGDFHVEAPFAKGCSRLQQFGLERL